MGRLRRIYSRVASFSKLVRVRLLGIGIALTLLGLALLIPTSLITIIEALCGCAAPSEAKQLAYMFAVLGIALMWIGAAISVAWMVYRRLH